MDFLLTSTRAQETVKSVQNDRPKRNARGRPKSAPSENGKIGQEPRGNRKRQWLRIENCRNGRWLAEKGKFHKSWLFL